MQITFVMSTVHGAGSAELFCRRQEHCRLQSQLFAQIPLRDRETIRRSGRSRRSCTKHSQNLIPQSLAKWNRRTLGGKLPPDLLDIMSSR